MSNIAEVPLTRGYAAIVDAEDAHRVLAFKWSTVLKNGKPYAHGWVNGRVIYLHRFLMGDPSGIEIDHEDCDGLNCRRSNMRFATKQQNGANRGPNGGSVRPNTSGFKGVSWDKERERWQAGVVFCGRRIALGRFDSREDAARAYDTKAREIFGEFARTNFPA